jgi:hypothetical protein
LAQSKEKQVGSIFDMFVFWHLRLDMGERGRLNEMTWQRKKKEREREREKKKERELAPRIEEE